MNEPARLNIRICLLLALSIFVVYGRLVQFDFVNYDDPYNVGENPHVLAGLSSESIAWAFTNGHVGQWIPLSWLSLMLDRELYGLNAGGFHLTNVLLHAINAMLLFVVFHRMTGATWRSAYVAALFAFHPLHVQSVAWITERRDVLSSVFWFLTIWAYIRYTTERNLRRYLLVVLCYMLGMMAKPMLVTLPFVLLLLDVWPLRRASLRWFGRPDEQRTGTVTQSENRIVSVSQLVIEKIPLFCVSVVLSIVTFVFQTQLGKVLSTETLPIKLRLANVLVSYVRYIFKTIWPADLAVFYPYPQSLPAWQIAGAALFLVAVTFAVVRSARRQSYLPVGWFWYVGTFVPVIGFVQAGIQSMADHYSYIPLIGLFVMVAWGVPELAGRWRFRKVSLATLALISLSAFTVRAWFQVGYWKDSGTLARHALSVTDKNHVAHDILANFLVTEGRVAEAIEHYREAVRIEPAYANARHGLAVCLAWQGNHQEALDHYRHVLRINPKQASVHFDLARTLSALGQTEEAVAHFREAARLKPDWPEPRKALEQIAPTR